MEGRKVICSRMSNINLTPVMHIHILPSLLCKSEKYMHRDMCWQKTRIFLKKQN